MDYLNDCPRTSESAFLVRVYIEQSLINAKGYVVDI